MGSLRLTLCTAALAVAALTPVAQAADGGTVSVTPSTPAPGADLTLRVTGCAGRTATAASAAFVADARLTVADGSLAGETRVRSSIEPGSYDVKIVCADFEVKGRITVVAANGGSAPPSPVAPVDAGGGWAATHLSAMEPRATGPGTGQAVTGLVLAGVAAVAVVLRGHRRGRRKRGTD
ncbi:hypothetical protein AB0D34_31350 [Streptomyces sp. NPDC048420]|uniref:hypothetical protein n=1 Tax=Streptomyces sp. NPDC048420 TaxID=3155755 RepID=UPI003413095D